MKVTLELLAASSPGKRWQVVPGQAYCIGRIGRADLVIEDDSYMSGLHFALECDEHACFIRDLNSNNGTFLNGAKVIKAVVHDGDQIIAGQTRFVVHIKSELEGVTPALPASENSTLWEQPPQSLLQFLREQPDPLFALLDAARDPRVLELLHGSDVECQSLYSGAKGEELGAFAPYLVYLPAQSSLLEILVQEGWGKSWGVYLTCVQPLEAVRKHFRHFLMVKLEDGQEVYFRFYDPRVLRIFLPTCRPEEEANFFGPVSCYLMEAEEPEFLLLFTHSKQGVERKMLPILIEEGMVRAMPDSLRPPAGEALP